MRLARALCDIDRLSTSGGEPQRIHQVVLFDHVNADLEGQDKRIRSVVGDVSSADDLKQAMGDGVDSIFHLAAVVSGQAEQDFDLGMRGECGCIALAVRNGAKHRKEAARDFHQLSGGVWRPLACDRDR